MRLPSTWADRSPRRPRPLLRRTRLAGTPESRSATRPLMSRFRRLRRVVLMPSPAANALAGEFDQAGPARWEQMHRALNRALNGVIFEHCRAILAVYAAHHHAATTTDANAR